MNFSKKDKKILLILGILMAIFFGIRMYYVFEQIGDMKDSEIIIKEHLADIEKENYNKNNPDFYYFVSEKDQTYNQAIALFLETSEKYKDKINFTLVKTDEKIIQSLPFLVGNMPAVVLDTDEKIAGYYYRAIDIRAMEEQAKKLLKAHEKQKNKE